MIKAVIFDVDGVLLESEHLIREAEVKTFKKFGIPATIELVSQYTGIRLEEETEDIGKKFGVSLPIEEVLKAQNENLMHFYKQIVQPTPHIKEVLNMLQLTYILGIATSRSKQMTNSALQRLDLFPYFRAFTYGEDVGKAKPDPEAFLRTAKLLDIDSSNCVVVEDSNPGFRAGKAAGMLVIARRAVHNIETDFSSADFIVDDAREIPKILASQNMNI
ncbi:MAG: HAD family phosphatase [Candidatus Daviesbacteria bacterium]|nr:HAD family phosphatase [Candidatus Daviesbacteria bacterium]